MTATEAIAADQLQSDLIRRGQALLDELPEAARRLWVKHRSEIALAARLRGINEWAYLVDFLLDIRDALQPATEKAAGVKTVGSGV